MSGAWNRKRIDPQGSVSADDLVAVIEAAEEIERKRIAEIIAAEIAARPTIVSVRAGDLSGLQAAIVEARLMGIAERISDVRALVLRIEALEQQLADTSAKRGKASKR